MRSRDFDVADIEEVAGGLLIRITPLNKVLSRYTNLDINRTPVVNANHFMPGVALSQAEAEESNYYGYKCNLPVHIPGDTAKRAMNIVLVNGVKVFIGDVPFALFLRLVVELTKTKRVAVSRGKLMNTGLIKPGGEFQSVSRLRQAFRIPLGCLSPEDFIETCERKSIRLSIHPSLITYDKERLIGHRNQKIRRLARRLP